MEALLPELSFSPKKTKEKRTVQIDYLTTKEEVCQGNTTGSCDVRIVESATW